MANRPFRLQAVLRVREMRRDALRKRYAEAASAEQVLLRQGDGLKAEIDELTRQRREEIASGGVGASNLLATQRYDLALRGKQHKLRDDLEKVAEETEQRRAALAEAEREVRVIEKLRERHDEAERRERERREALRMDEAALRGHAVRRDEDRPPVLA